MQEIISVENKILFSKINYFKVYRALQKYEKIGHPGRASRVLKPIDFQHRGRHFALKFP